MTHLIKYFDMFAGIGGFRAGLDRAGGFQCVGHCEIDKYADASYRAIHNIDEDQIDKILAINSDSQAYKQAGNSVSSSQSPLNSVSAWRRKLRSLPCSSSPHKIFDLAGAPFCVIEAIGRRLREVDEELKAGAAA